MADYETSRMRQYILNPSFSPNYGSPDSSRHQMSSSYSIRQHPAMGKYSTRALSQSIAKL